MAEGYEPIPEESRYRVMTSGSLLDIKEPGIYYLGGNVTDKPTRNGGVFIIGKFNDDVMAGIFIAAYSNECYAFRILNGVLTSYSLL